MTIAAHETRTASGITIPDPDQGTPYLLINFAMPSTQLMVWEPFEDGAEGGHNLYGFLARWDAWTRSEEPFLEAIDPRFGHPMAIPRSAIPQVIGISIQYHRKEDTRAGVRGLAVPGGGVRRLPDGSIEIQVPR
jgi:hypothetical protein